MLAIDPRSRNATSNCAADNIALLDLAVSALRLAYGQPCHLHLHPTSGDRPAGPQKIVTNCSASTS